MQYFHTKHKRLYSMVHFGNHAGTVSTINVQQHIVDLIIIAVLDTGLGIM